MVLPSSARCSRGRKAKKQKQKKPLPQLCRISKGTISKMDIELKWIATDISLTHQIAKFKYQQIRNGFHVLAGTAENIGMLKDTVKKNPESKYLYLWLVTFKTWVGKENYSPSADVSEKIFKFKTP